MQRTEYGLDGHRPVGSHYATDGGEGDFLHPGTLSEQWSAAGLNFVYESRAGWLKASPGSAPGEQEAAPSLQISGTVNSDTFRFDVDRQFVNSLVGSLRSDIVLEDLSASDAALVVEQAAIELIEIAEERYGVQIELVEVNAAARLSTSSTLHGILSWNTDPHRYGLTFEEGPVTAALEDHILAKIEADARADAEAKAVSDSSAVQDSNDLGSAENAEVVQLSERSMPEGSDPSPEQLGQAMVDPDVAREAPVVPLETAWPVRQQDTTRAIIGPVLLTWRELQSLGPGAVILLENSDANFVSGFITTPQDQKWRIETDGERAVVFGRISEPLPQADIDGQGDNELPLFIEVGNVHDAPESFGLADVVDIESNSQETPLLLNNRTVALGRLVRVEDTLGLKIQMKEAAE